jgi:hypothetical protein
VTDITPSGVGLGARAAGVGVWATEGQADRLVMEDRSVLWRPARRGTRPGPTTGERVRVDGGTSGVALTAEDLAGSQLGRERAGVGSILGA